MSTRIRLRSRHRLWRQVGKQPPVRRSSAHRWQVASRLRYRNLRLFGRAFVKPFDAQTNHPLFWGGVAELGASLLPAVRTVPTVTIASVALGDYCTPTLVCWKCAAGAFRLIAAVVRGPHCFFCPRECTWLLWCQLFSRSDDPFGIQEALAVWLLLHLQV